MGKAISQTGANASLLRPCVVVDPEHLEKQHDREPGGGEPVSLHCAISSMGTSLGSNRLARSRPVAAVQRPVLYCLGDVHGFNGLFAAVVGDGADDSQDAPRGRGEPVRLSSGVARTANERLRHSRYLTPMRSWWVNQNQTFRHELAGGYLWPPKRNANGARNSFTGWLFPRTPPSCRTRGTCSPARSSGPPGTHPEPCASRR